MYIPKQQLAELSSDAQYMDSVGFEKVHAIARQDGAVYATMPLLMATDPLPKFYISQPQILNLPG